MEKLPHVVTHYTTVDKWPSSLKDVKETAKTLHIGEKRLLELAYAGYAPCYRVDDGVPMFKIAEVRQWLAENLLHYNPGMPFPRQISVILEALPEGQSNEIPRSISALPNIRDITHFSCGPGVYFLCHEGEVVYVGQSNSPASRIATHITEATKVFDRVYLLPAPKSDLLQVESAMIRLLKPKYNGTKHGEFGPLDEKIMTQVSKRRSEIDKGNQDACSLS